MKLATKTLRRSAALLTVLMLGGCEGVFGTDAEVYSLVSVDGEAVPAPSNAIIQHVSGDLTLFDDNRSTLRIVSRCNPNPPPGTGCELTINGALHRGTYSRSEGLLRLGTLELQARFENRKVVVTDSCMNPATCSRVFTTVYEFRR